MKRKNVGIIKIWICMVLYGFMLLLRLTELYP